jgi:hypothetical protein
MSRWTEKSGLNFEAAHHGETNVWLTPPELVKALGEFDLDPCASYPRPWDLAKANWSLEQDGDSLQKGWMGRVWCNPPYGPNTKHWLKKCSDHGNAIALVFSRVETNGFFNAWKTASAMLFLPGRLSFYTQDGQLSKGKPAANVLIAWGDDNAAALLKSGLSGAFVSGIKVIDGRRIN